MMKFLSTLNGQMKMIKMKKILTNKSGYKTSNKNESGNFSRRATGGIMTFN